MKIVAFNSKVVAFEKRLTALQENTGKNRRAALELLNERHFTVHVGSKYVVCDNSTRQHAAMPQRPTDFKLRYLPQKYRVRGRLKSLGDIWLNWPDRRSFAGELVFKPTGAEGEHDGTEDYNTWRGFRIGEHKGDWSLFRDHLRKIVCQGNDKYFDYLLDYFAHMVQFPGRLPGVAIVIHGPQGTGKTIVYKMLELLFHPFNSALFEKSTRITGNFNSHVAGKIWVCADEAFFARDKQIVGALKSTITAECMYFEAKHMDAVPFDNYIRLLITSNDEHVVHVSKDERRYFVLEPADTYAQRNTESLETAAARRRPYFDAISKQMKVNGGAAAMFYDLRRRDIAKFDPRMFPDTPYLQRQKELSRDPHEQWWADVLERGDARWFEKPVHNQTVFQHHDDYMKNHNHRHVITHQQIGRFLCGLYGLGILHRPREQGKQISVYILPPLEDARKMWERGWVNPSGKLRVRMRKTGGN